MVMKGHDGDYDTAETVVIMTVMVWISIAVSLLPNSMRQQVPKRYSAAKTRGLV